MTETQSPWVDDQTWKTRWEKLEELEGGGQGEAYRARRLSDGKIGFLKIIKSKNVAERRARFFREAIAYDSYGVNGIPKLIESNAHRHAEGNITPFIVTEFIEGATLRSWRQSQASVSIEAAVRITSRLLDILQACHAQGCVHRDVKPDNIILDDGASARVWLLDFGISYHDLADTDFQTEHWQEVGNRFLRLPELSAGSLSKQDPRSDICFAAGILFYLLTGEHPDVLVDSEGRLPHQRVVTMTLLQRAAAHRLARLLALFDDAFETRIAHRFATVQAMRERMDKMMQEQSLNSSAEENLAAIREVLDTSANRRRTETIAKLREAQEKFQKACDVTMQSTGGNLSLTLTDWLLTAEISRNTLFWTRLGSTDRILSVTCEAMPAGEELVLQMAGETVYRTDFAQPDYGDNFDNAVREWILARLRAILDDPNALPTEADIFREIKPFGSLEAAAVEAERRDCSILAFVYDPTQPERGQLHWALSSFLKNRRTRDILNAAFVTALVPLATNDAVCDFLNQQSMETSRWVVLNRQLRPLEQQVIYANPQEAERIVGELAERYAVASRPPA